MIRLSATQLTTFTECPRKWYYNYHMRRCKPSTPAMAKGSCFHRIFELHFGEELPLDEIPKKIITENPEYEEHLAICMTAFIGYKKENNNLEFVKVDGKNAVEQEFVLTLEDDVILRGKIDYIRKIGNRAYITDIKCTGMYLSDYYFGQFELGFQPMLYSYVGSNFFNENFDNFKIEGFMIDAVMMRKNSDVKFDKCFYPLLPNLDEFIDEIYRTAHFIKENLPSGESAFEHRWTSCVNKFGKCQYFEVCKAPSRVREELLNLDEFVDYRPIYLEGDNDNN